MRKIVAGLFVSLDGVVESPQNWHFPWMNDEMAAAVIAAQTRSDTLLLGRTTYESFASTWPHQTGVMADNLNNIRKIVVSSTLEKAEWNNSALISGDVAAQLAKLKEEPGKDISLTGSITLTRHLLRAGLVDELHLHVHPVVLGTGMRLFDESVGRLPLTLVESTTFATGAVHLHYQPAQGDPR